MKDAYRMKCESAVAQIKDVDGKQGIVTGYFSNFDTVDSDRDVIRRGAFTKSIRENGPGSAKPRIKHLLNHNTSQPLGNLLVLQEDDKGLYYESQVGTHGLGQDFIKMIESGLIQEHSIGFNVIKRNQVGEWDKGDDAVWELTELKLWEGSSLTSWGANSNTPLVGMKSEQKAANAAKRVSAISKALRTGSLTDETCELLEIELKQLEQLFIDLTKNTTEPKEIITQPEKKGDILTNLFTFKQKQNEN